MVVKIGVRLDSPYLFDSTVACGGSYGTVFILK